MQFEGDSAQFEGYSAQFEGKLAHFIRDPSFYKKLLSSAQFGGVWRRTGALYKRSLLLQKNYSLPRSLEENWRIL